MKKWKSTEKRKDGVWTSEIRLKVIGLSRKGKVKKLLNLLKEEVIEDIS